jgi:aromatase
MAHTVNSIFIKAPFQPTFDISNNIERWTELFGDEYVSAEVLSREGNEITFKLTDDENKSWVSKRWLHPEQKFAYASRHEPMFPFKFMKIIWLYEEGECPENGKGTLMTWIQDFVMDPKFTKFTAEEIEGFINKHSIDNMNIFKKVIEKEASELAAQK